MRLRTSALAALCALVLTVGTIAPSSAQSHPRLGLDRSGFSPGSPRLALAIDVAAAADAGASPRRELETALRAVVSDDPRLRLVESRSGARYLVTGSIVELTDHVVSSDEREVRCRVSLVVAEARSGAIRAMLEGRSGVRGAPEDRSMRERALRGALRGAIRSMTTLR